MNSSNLPKWLTYSGALPFVGLALALFFQEAVPVEVTLLWQMFLTYSVVILSFIAGMHWGLAVSHQNIPSRYLFIISNAVALMAWCVLFFPVYAMSLGVLMVGFAITLIIDLKLSTFDVYEPWFLSVRIRVTTVVLATHLGLLAFLLT